MKKLILLFAVVFITMAGTAQRPLTGSESGGRQNVNTDNRAGTPSSPTWSRGTSTSPATPAAYTAPIAPVSTTSRTGIYLSGQEPDASDFTAQFDPSFERVAPLHPHRYYVGVGYHIGFQTPAYFVTPDFKQTPALMLGYMRYKWDMRGLGANFSYMRLTHKPLQGGMGIRPGVVATSGEHWVATSQDCFSITPTFSQRFYMQGINSYLNLDVSAGVWLDFRKEYKVRWGKYDPNVKCAFVAEIYDSWRTKLHPGLAGMIALSGETPFDRDWNTAVYYSVGVSLPAAFVVAVGIRFGRPAGQ
jgi:hypothetical protein